MENAFDWQMWAVLAAAPCFVAWLLGSLHGEARMRRAFGFAELTAPRAAAPMAGESEPGKSDADTVQVEESDTAPLGRDETILALNNLREHTQHIRKSAKLWDDPEVLRELHNPDPVADQVLSHYRGSISALEKANGKRRLHTPSDGLPAMNLGPRKTVSPQLMDTQPMARAAWTPSRE